MTVSVNLSTPKCPYCQADAALVRGRALYEHRPELWARWYWVCAPCDASVGCHERGRRARGVVSDGTLPFGRLANAPLRALRGHAHQAFDRLWHGGGAMTRSDAYAWLAEAMGLPREAAHIGNFDEAQCERLLAVLASREAA